MLRYLLIVTVGFVSFVAHASTVLGPEIEVNAFSAQFGVASNGSNYLIWSSNGLAMIVRDDSHVAEPHILPFEPAYAASNGREYLLVGRNVAQRFSEEGKAIGEPFPLAIAGPVAWTGSSYLVVASTGTRWSTAGAFGQIVGMRISSDGRILDPEPFLISLGTVADAHVLPVVGSNRTRTVVTWSGVTRFANCLMCRYYNEAIESAVVSEAGIALDRFQIAPQSTTVTIPAALVASEDGFLAVWLRGGSLEWTLMGADGAPDGMVRSLTPGNRYFLEPPSATWDGETLKLVWSTDVGDILLARIDRTGRTDLVPVAESNDVERNPQIASAGRRHSLVVYARADRLFMRFVTDVGEPRRRAAGRGQRIEP